MDISGNGINQPVGFYQKNTGNNIGYHINDDNGLYVSSNVFSREMQTGSSGIAPVLKGKRRKKSRRLNTVDTDYLPDDTELNAIEQNSENFFVTEKNNGIYTKIFKSITNFFNAVPLINYFFLKNKEENIRNTVTVLNDINQNVDELMNTTAPSGEESDLYDNIAKSLTKAANIIGETNKKNW